MTATEKKSFENSYLPSLRFSDGDTYIKIMAVVDGYVMFRRKGCMPLVETYDQFKNRIVNSLIS